MNKKFVLTLFSILLTCMFATGCSKQFDYSRLAMQYKQECFGDLTVECRDMLIRLKVSLEEAKLEMLRSKKERYIQCRGEADYEELQSLIRDYAGYLDGLRPGFFARHFFGSAEVELPQDAFPQRMRLRELERSSCHPSSVAQQGSASD
jgi:hypothetical protein